MDSWIRSSPSIYDDPNLTSNAETGAKLAQQNSEVAETEAPPMIPNDNNMANETRKLPETNVQHLNRITASTFPGREASILPRPSKASSFGISTVVIVMLSFAIGTALGLVWSSELSGNANGWRSTYESIVSTLPKLISAQTPPASVSDSLNETTNQLQSIGTELSSLRQDLQELKSLREDVTSLRQNVQELTSLRQQDTKELTSLRQDIRSLAGDITQIRQPQGDRKSLPSGPRPRSR